MMLIAYRRTRPPETAEDKQWERGVLLMICETAMEEVPWLLQGGDDGGDLTDPDRGYSDLDRAYNLFWDLASQNWEDRPGLRHKFEVVASLLAHRITRGVVTAGQVALAERIAAELREVVEEEQP